MAKNKYHFVIKDWVKKKKKKNMYRKEKDL